MFKMKRCVIFSMLLFVQLNLFSVTFDADCQDPVCSTFFNFYSHNKLSTALAGRGYTGVALMGDISTAVTNPASINFQKAQLYFEYGHKNEIEWLQEYYPGAMLLKYKSGMIYAFGYRISDYFQAGLIYKQDYNYEVDYGELNITDNYGNIIATFDYYAKVSIASISVPVSYNFSNYLFFGVDLNFNIYHSENPELFFGSDIDVIKGEVDFVLFRPKFGIIIKPFDYLNFGLTYLPATNKQINKKVKWGEIKYDENTFPLELRIGTAINIQKIPIKFLFDYFHSQNSEETILVNRNDFHFGIEYDLLNNLTIRSGFFTQFDYRNMSLEGFEGEDYWLDMSSYDQKFLTLGTSFKWRKSTFSLAILDSHLLTEGKIEQTYLKFSYKLDIE